VIEYALSCAMATQVAIRFATISEAHEMIRQLRAVGVGNGSDRDTVYVSTSDIALAKP
jgi:hypothetical protein